jgi:hypothetical protein
MEIWKVTFIIYILIKVIENFFNCIF